MDKLKFAIAGRSKERLEEVKKKWCKIDPKLADLEILVVNLDKDSEVINLVKNTKVILSSAGPFFFNWNQVGCSVCSLRNRLLRHHWRGCLG